MVSYWMNPKFPKILRVLTLKISNILFILGFQFLQNYENDYYSRENGGETFASHRKAELSLRSIIPRT